MPEQRFDLAILGSGPAGYVAAIRAGQLGMKTAVVERDEKKYGGTCLHRGCIPTKVLLHAAHAYTSLGDLKRYGLQGASVKLDWKTLLGFKDRIVGRLNAGVEALLKKGRATVIHGRGRLLDARRIEVDAGSSKETVVADKVILATGSEPRSLPNLPNDGKAVITSTEALELAECPKSVLVVGAGAIGAEFASLFLGLGSEVTLVEVLPRVLPLEDADLSAELAKLLRKRGMEIHLEAKVEKAQAGPGGVEVTVLPKDGKPVGKKVEKVLVAVGRKPNTDDLGLEKTRAKVERGFLRVNEFGMTDEPGLYAVGDIVPTPQLAHVASMEGIIAVEHAKGIPTRPIDPNRIPNVTFCDPQVASIGLSEEKARQAGYDVRVGRFPFAALGKAMLMWETDGFVKVVAEAKYGEVLGVHILHARAEDLISEGIAALAGELTVDDLARAIHPHPTLSEAIAEAAHAATGHALHL